MNSYNFLKGRPVNTLRASLVIFLEKEMTKMTGGKCNASDHFYPRRPGPDDADIDSVNLLRHIPRRLTAALVFRQGLLDISSRILDVFAQPFNGLAPDERENEGTSYCDKNNLTHGISLLF